VNSSEDWRPRGRDPAATNRVRARARALFAARLAERGGMYHLDVTDAQAVRLADWAAHAAAQAADEETLRPDPHERPTTPAPKEPR